MDRRDRPLGHAGAGGLGARRTGGDSPREGRRCDPGCGRRARALRNRTMPEASRCERQGLRPRQDTGGRIGELEGGRGPVGPGSRRLLRERPSRRERSSSDILESGGIRSGGHGEAGEEPQSGWTHRHPQEIRRIRGFRRTQHGLESQAVGGLQARREEVRRDKRRQGRRIHPEARGAGCPSRLQGSDGPGDGDARIPEGCEPIGVPTSIGAVDETGGSFRTVMGSDLSASDRG